ncbi:hypothetical protein BU23DRAFT_563805 [Bimuria novae-zelandiae CBS 107.79]|uniref:FAD-binding domain-containing protein n=1 Tax=Bimuria novae-zelandiae CBS 107.79 TaxID=1447943 RepID=A0A6A5VPR5_9PLEO|nr:hypothetical protein BU23DRAFT_563805 [Bimuria novae-zelandiae CBS 107.79]
MDKSLTSSTAPEWAPILKKLIALTPLDTIVNFELFWRNPQPKWNSPDARVVQIGDCAHSFLPSSENGATQAIEDAVSLASCLELGVKLHEKCLKGIRAGVPLDQDPNIPPNYPPGYKWEPWHINNIMRDLEAGKAVELGSGNWN